jgi:hypothetical protein
MYAETYGFKYILFNRCENDYGTKAPHFRSKKAEPAPKARMLAQQKKPRISAAFAVSDIDAADQRVTTTGVPTETRW